MAGSSENTVQHSCSSTGLLPEIPGHEDAAQWGAPSHLTASESLQELSAERNRRTNRTLSYREKRSTKKSEAAN